ncbi:MAG: hypothetical protein ACYTXI_43690, partial [Nostoc sp.]
VNLSSYSVKRDRISIHRYYKTARKRSIGNRHLVPLAAIAADKRYASIHHGFMPSYIVFTVLFHLSDLHRLLLH